MGCHAASARIPLPIYVVDWGTNGEGKIDDVPHRGRAEETGRFLDLLHVFMQHAQGEGAQAFGAGEHDEWHSLRIFSVAWYPDRR